MYLEKEGTVFFREKERERERSELAQVNHWPLVPFKDYSLEDWPRDAIQH